MKTSHTFLSAARIVAVAAVLFGSAALGSHETTVGEITFHIGVIPGPQALLMPGEAEAHPSLGQDDMHHLVVTLIDHKTGKRIDDADVTVEVQGAMAGMQKKKLMWHAAAGSYDFSEAFKFDRSGPYVIRVWAVRKADNKQVAATFHWEHTD